MYVIIYMYEAMCCIIADEGAVGVGPVDVEVAVLGARHGRVAAATQHPATQVATDGEWSGRAQRIRARHTHPQHAHPHVRLLPQSVGGTASISTILIHSLIDFVSLLSIAVFFCARYQSQLMFLLTYKPN